MSKLLDDHEFELKPETPKKEEPMAVVGIASFVVLLGFLIMQVSSWGTSERALVKGSYYWMPFLVIGILGFILPPKKAFFFGVMTIPATFIFYRVIWPSL